MSAGTATTHAQRNRLCVLVLPGTLDAQVLLLLHPELSLVCSTYAVVCLCVFNIKFSVVEEI